MSNLDEYIRKYGLEKAENDYGEMVYTTPSIIVFPNFTCASIIKRWDDDYRHIIGYSVAMRDWNGYFDWTAMNEYGAKDGCFCCDDENDVIEACEIIRHYQGCNNNNNNN